MITQKNYGALTKKAVPSSALVSDTLKAFFVGGAICTVGQALMELYLLIGLSQETAETAVPVTLVVISAILTGIGVYGKIADFAGAGTLVPITGFANSVVSPALEFQSEGRITGTGAKMFTIAGPVIVYGCLSSFIYGIIYLAVTRL